LLYSAFTLYLGFTVNSGEYKLMGLAPYGNPESDQTKRYIRLIRENLLQIRDDGSIWLNQKYFRYATGLSMVNEKRWEELFGFPLRKPEDPLEQYHCNLAWAIQHITEEIILKMAAEAKRITGSDVLCLAGGVALNCVANGKLLTSGIFRDIFIQPAAGDAGGAPGAALTAYHLYFNGERTPDPLRLDGMSGAYLGPSYTDRDIEFVSRKFNAVSRRYEHFSLLCEDVADLIAGGFVVGWFQDRMEFGPRALGNRSILGDARNPEMQKKLNLKIKYREGFRPFAPAVLMEECSTCFDLDIPSPYMLMVSGVRHERRNPLPENYFDLTLNERLYFQRSDIPAVTHLDYSARIQTVHKATNPKFWQLIDTFRQKTGYGVIVNTSFNVRGEPIVCSPDDAYRCFMRTEMDFLVIENYLFDKNLQPEKDNKDKWKEFFKPD
jgi:carbamoyltransferase